MHWDEKVMTHEHTDRSYERALQEIREHVQRMGTQVCGMLTRTMHALIAGDRDSATATIAADKTVNSMEVETDEMCMAILARRQPVASDLRFIAAALKLDTDLERIGDLCANACERIIQLQEEDLDVEIVARFSDIGARVHTMIENAVRAFVTGDAVLAEAVMSADQVIDKAYAHISGFLIVRMRQRPDSLADATQLLSIAKYLERMGDHASNLAEMVIFMVEGRDVRHPGRLEAAGATN